jgi:hypothetical protein
MPLDAKRPNDAINNASDVAIIIGHNGNSANCISTEPEIAAGRTPLQSVVNAAETVFRESGGRENRRPLGQEAL